MSVKHLIPNCFNTGTGWYNILNTIYLIHFHLKSLYFWMWVPENWNYIFGSQYISIGQYRTKALVSMTYVHTTSSFVCTCILMVPVTKSVSKREEPMYLYNLI